MTRRTSQSQSPNTGSVCGLPPVLTIPWGRFILEPVGLHFSASGLSVSMAHRSFRSLVSLSTLCAAAFAGECLAPRSVQAACGDYVHLRGSHAPTLADEGTPSALTDVGALKYLPPERKCHGPLCRSEGPQPPAPAPVPPAPAAEDWASLTASERNAADGSRNMPTESKREVARGHAGRVDRPPRAGS